ncbi:hypothetical protein Tco_1135581 [Tanacetum coccineum]
MQKEKEQKDKLNTVKAQLIYGEESGVKIRSHEESHYSESKTPTARTEPEEGAETGIPEAHRYTQVFSKDLRGTDPLLHGPGHGKKEACLIGWEERSKLHSHVLIGVNKREHRLVRPANIQKVKIVKGGGGTCGIENSLLYRGVRHFSLPRTRMPSHVKTYDGSGDPEDHLKLFQSAAKTEGWAMPT